MIGEKEELRGSGGFLEGKGWLMADWSKIKTEYITTNTSYRKLAQKYGLNQATIAQRAKAEDWVGKRKQQEIKTQAKILDAASDKAVARAARIMTVADKLLDRIEAIVVQEEGLAGKDIRALTAAVKDLKEIQSIRSDLDEREQRARIASLEKQAEGSGTPEAVSVVLAPGLEEFAQ